jgi:hypothetical protein
MNFRIQQAALSSILFLDWWKVTIHHTTYLTFVSRLTEYLTFIALAIKAKVSSQSADKSKIWLKFNKSAGWVLDNICSYLLTIYLLSAINDSSSYCNKNYQAFVGRMERRGVAWLALHTSPISHQVQPLRKSWMELIQTSHPYSPKLCVPIQY